MAASSHFEQFELFDHVVEAYANTPADSLDNERLYRTVARLSTMSDDDIDRRAPIGKAKAQRSPLKRKIRWHQQTLKQLGLLERVPDQRGAWRLTEEGKNKVKLRKAEPTFAMLAFSTDLGIAIWGTSNRVFGQLNEPIHLCLTSPPYPLRNPRAYGNPPESAYVDFICETLEPIVRNLCPGGSIALNLGNDLFQEGNAARSLYRERVVIGLCDRLGLHKMDELIWESNKAPAPYQWSSRTRTQLRVAYEPVYWFTNSPHHIRSDNRRVLQPHTNKHQKLIDAGGERREASYCDGAYSVRPGSYSNKTKGKIPCNVLHFSNYCADQRRYKKRCKELGLPEHGAPMPRSLIRFLIKFLTREGDLVVDNMAGSLSTGTEAEELGRRWVVTDQMYEYVRGGAERFSGFPGYQLEPDFDAVMNTNE